MNEGEITRWLTNGNTWWRHADWQRDDRDLRSLAASRLDYSPTPLEDIAPGGVYVVRGPRRVGKSLELKRTISRLIQRGVAPRRIIHFACDELSKGDLRRLVTAGRDTLTRNVSKPRYWFLDEITNVPDWPATVKWLLDNTGFQDDCVVLTGSSARDLTEAQKNLAGRLGSAKNSNRLLLPMSFRAFCHAIGLSAVPATLTVRPKDFVSSVVEEAIYELQVWLDDLASAWELYLRVGGFPRAVDDYLKHGDVREDFVQALWDVVAGEAVRRSTTSAAQTQALLTVLAKSLTSPVNMSNLARQIGVESYHTAKARVDDLILAYLAWRCHQAGDHNLPNLDAQSKFYFTDPLLARLAHLRTDQAPEPDVSRLSEQQLGFALLRRIEEDEPSSFAEFTRLMYAKSARKEIDFISPSFSAMGFEGKYVDKGWRQEALTLQRRFNRGVLATRSVLDTSREIWAVPAGIIGWLLSD